MLADAAQRAADGAYVFIIGADEHHTQTLRDQFLQTHGGDPVGGGKVYYKSNGGSVQFSAPADRFNWDLLGFPGAHQSCVMLVDHYAIERRFSKVLEMLHRYDHQPD